LTVKIASTERRYPRSQSQQKHFANSNAEEQKGREYLLVAYAEGNRMGET
jgi:hypothetical protein